MERTGGVPLNFDHFGQQAIPVKESTAVPTPIRTSPQYGGGASCGAEAVGTQLLLCVVCARGRSNWSSRFRALRNTGPNVLRPCIRCAAKRDRLPEYRRGFRAHKNKHCVLGCRQHSVEVSKDRGPSGGRLLCQPGRTQREKMANSWSNKSIEKPRPIRASPPTGKLSQKYSSHEQAAFVSTIYNTN